MPFTPAELFRAAIGAIDVERFVKRSPKDQDDGLRALQNGAQDLGGVPADVFFEALLALTVQGYFSDPAYGGNRGMAAWKMIGFPGAYANHYELVDQHNVKFTAAPVSPGQDARGRVHPIVAEKRKP